MVSIDATSKKYHGKMASDYEENRREQGRWKIENAEVERLLTELRPKSVLDVPVGTGRFIPVYDKLRVKHVVGVDISSSMLAIAGKKRVKYSKVKLYEGDARKIKESVDVAVCVRFLDLIDEKAMYAVMANLLTCANDAVICTIRFGKKYVPKSNTAEHNEKQFRKFVRVGGWEIKEAIPIFTLGWHILLIQ